MRRQVAEMVKKYGGQAWRDECWLPRGAYVTLETNNAHKKTGRVIAIVTKNSA